MIQAVDLSAIFAANVVFAAISFSAAVGLLLLSSKIVVRSPQPSRLAVLAVNVLAALLTWQWMQSSLALLPATFLGLLVLVIASHALKGFSFTGRFLMAMLANTIFAGLLWGVWIVASADVGATTLALLCATFPLAAISLAPFKMWLRVKEKQIQSQSDLAAEKSAQYAQHQERVEARLRVLEQIVTDRGVETASQIEALRDQARIPSGEKPQ